VVAAMAEVQDYVERIVRHRLAELPTGEWQTVDYLDADPGHPEGLIPVALRMTIDENGIHYDLAGSAPVVSTFLNSGYGATFSALYAGTKTFFPEVPLDSGFYRWSRPTSARRARSSTPDGRTP
jgi:N-methylhydantoinase B